MSFSDIFTAEIDANLLDLLGDACTYNGAPINAIIETSLQDVAMLDAYTTTSTLSVRALKSDLPKVKRGSKILYEGKTIIVDAIVNDTGSLITLACRYG